MAEVKRQARRGSTSEAKAPAAPRATARKRSATVGAAPVEAVVKAFAPIETKPRKVRAVKTAAKARPVTRKAPRSAPVVAPAAEPKHALSDSHKEALAAGREEGRVVRSYLDAVSRPKRPGRKRTVESVEAQLAQIDSRIGASTASDRLSLIQQRFDLKSELATLKADAGLDLDALEVAFVAVAPGYGKRKGISYAAWRAAGVSADTLRRAGIGRAKQ
jgi:hypothetical protein